MDRGAWRATVHRVAKESDMTEVTQHTKYRLDRRGITHTCMRTHTHTHTHCPHRPVYKKNHGRPNSLAMSGKSKLAEVAFHPPVPVTDCINHILK